MRPCTFETDYTPEELERKFEEFAAKVDEEMRSWLLQYCFEPLGDGSVEVLPRDGDYYGKHYACKYLARFISTVIRPGTYALLEFVGEDDECWGYFITAGRVDPLAYVRCVCRDGKEILLEEAIKELELRESQEQAKQKEA